jgi:hypothetical protein
MGMGMMRHYEPLLRAISWDWVPLVGFASVPDDRFKSHLYGIFMGMGLGTQVCTASESTISSNLCEHLSKSTGFKKNGDSAAFGWRERQDKGRGHDL